MTLEEKIAQIRHIHSWNIFDEQDLNETKLQEFVGDLCWGFVEMCIRDSDKSYYTKVETIARELMSSSYGYRLSADYTKMFRCV